MNRNNIKPLLLLALVSFVALFALGYIRNLTGMDYSTVISFCSYVLLYLYFEKRYAARLSPNMVMWALLSPMLIIVLPLRITSFQGTLSTLPESVVQFAAILIARVRFKRRFVRWSVLTCLAVLIAIGSFSLYEYWFNYRHYSSFTENVSEKSDVAVQGKDQNGDVFFVGEQADLWVLDFWHTSCGSCFRKFPDLQKLSDAYKESETVKVLAVNIPLKRDRENASFDLLAAEGYDFKNIVALDSSLHKKLGIRVFPTTLLLDRHGYIHFRGDVKNVQDRIEQISK